MLTLLLDDKLYLAPVKEDCKKVLDLGTGTGIWAIDFADTHPSAEVVGVDLSPSQPSWVPPNCRFIVDDITQPGAMRNEMYDFIHLRCLMGSIADWPSLYRTIFASLQPGGWVQHLEMSIVFESDDDTIGDGHVMKEWSETFLRYGEQVGKTLDIASTCTSMIRDAGFQEVEEKWFKVPIGKWPRDPKLKEIGFWNFHYCYQGCEGWALYALVHVLGWSDVEARLYIARFRKELENRNNHGYYKVLVS